MGQLSVSTYGKERRCQSHGRDFQNLVEIGRGRQHHDAVFGRSSFLKARERGWGRIRGSLDTSAGNSCDWSYGQPSIFQDHREACAPATRSEKSKRRTLGEFKLFKKMVRRPRAAVGCRWKGAKPAIAYWLNKRSPCSWTLIRHSGTVAFMLLRIRIKTLVINK